ncbi:uncharacterized protein [Haliotis asinina]|uniref:uncharacterized protein n=1 Tax=Haliotis asinina TaxID=109174 RepID=UPI0035326D70
MEECQEHTDNNTPAEYKTHSDRDTSSDEERLEPAGVDRGNPKGAFEEGMAHAENTNEEVNADRFSDGTDEEEGVRIRPFVRDLASSQQHIVECCRQPQGETASAPQHQTQLQSSAGEVDQSQLPLSATSSVQALETASLTRASTGAACLVPQKASPQVPRTTALMPDSTLPLPPQIQGSIVSERQSPGLPIVPANGDSSTITQYNLMQVQQTFGDVTVKGSENLNIGGTQNVGTTPTTQEEEEKPLTAAQKIMKRTASRIQSWTKDMVETKALKKVKEKLDRGVTWVTIKGRPGEGKSTTAYMALNNLYSQGRQVYQVVSPAEFNEVIMACSNPVILLDDIFGDLEFDTAAWTKWRPSLRPILDVTKPDKYAEKDPERPKYDQTQLKQTGPNKDKTIIILVGRDYVLKSSSADLGRMADYISNPHYVVEVSSKRDSHERRKIWRVHAKSKHIDFEESVVSQICKVDCPHGFPHVCKMFATAYETNWTHLQTQMFFQAPLDFLRQTLDKCLQDMRKRSLFMAMIRRDGKISGLEMEEDVSLGYECIEAADDLVGSYLKKGDDIYMFDHPSIYDSVSFILSTKLSKFVIDNCSLSFIRQRLRLSPAKETEASVACETGTVANISWTYAGHLARRFASEIKKRNLWQVLSHQSLCNSDFVDLLMDCLKTQCHMHITDILKLTDISSKLSFCELLSSSKSHHLIKFLMEKENISFNRREGRDILIGVCVHAASSVLKYVIGHMKLHVNMKLRGRTPLMLAAGTKDSMFVNQILSLNPDLNARNEDGLSVFYYLCIHGLTSAVEHAIDNGVDVNKNHGSDEHPIYHAIRGGHLEVVKLLINRGCDIENQKGLKCAIFSQNETMVQFFLNRGVKVDAFAVCKACEVGEVNVVKMLFEKGATVNMKSSDGSTPLLSSCKGNPNVVSYLLKKGASVNKALHDTRDTPLHTAAGFGYAECVDVLLKAGADVNVQNNTGDTPLHRAAGQGSTECVDVLLKAEADVNVRSNTGDTPLHTAAGHGSIECVDVLLKAGANVNVQNNTGDTPLHTAAGHGSIECVDVLLKAGVNVNVQNNTGDTPLHAANAAMWGANETVYHLLKAEADVNVQNHTGNTPLHTAAEQGSTKCVDVLLNFGAGVNVQNDAGDTPLHAANAAMWGANETVYHLLKAEADVNVQNHTGNTPLHTAAEQGSTKCVDVLLKFGANVNVQNDTGDTPLHEAARFGSPECADMLLNGGAVVNVQNNAGDTPLHNAVVWHYTYWLHVLLAAGADVNVQNNTGDTPLHRAAGRGHTEYVDVLLEAGADVNVPNNTGDTPLHRAAVWGSTDCVHVLLKAGANVNVQNKSGNTPLLQAAGHGSADCVDVLLKARANVNVQKNTGDTTSYSNRAGI